MHIVKGRVVMGGGYWVGGGVGVPVRVWGCAREDFARQILVLIGMPALRVGMAHRTEGWHTGRRDGTQDGGFVSL
ncbi:MAG: hypothetical protein CMJ31_14715 [Phycisphaerae bacterium]|nr:hypothetical protein [Phycisphaerae bacterium]